MAVLLECSAGELVIDLQTEDCPIAAKNFLKLCKMKYYNGCLFYNVQQNYICQTGDPTGSGEGGSSIYGLLDGGKSASFQDEISKQRKMNQVGLVCMAHDQTKENANRSQFFITLRAEDFDNLDGKYTIFGQVAEGLEVLQKINELYCDGDGRPYQDMRIKHTYVLDDPFPDLLGLENLIPPSSPERSIPKAEQVRKRIPYEEGLEVKVDARTEAELELSIRSKEAKSRAIVLEMTGDIPDADVKPPDEVLFVCKLNSVTTDADLELIFSRFGTILQCDIIKDFKTGESLSYAFIEFETAASCIEAYEKMNNVLVDDRRIKVDFSQSVSNLWNRFLSKPRISKGQGQSQAVVQPHQQQQKQTSYRPPSPKHRQKQLETVHVAPNKLREGSRWSSNESRVKVENVEESAISRDRYDNGPHHSRRGNRERDGNHVRGRKSRSRSRSRSNGEKNRREDRRNSDRGDECINHPKIKNRYRDSGSNRDIGRGRSRSKDRAYERDNDRRSGNMDRNKEYSINDGRERDRDKKKH